MQASLLSISAPALTVPFLFPTTERDTKGKILCIFQGIGKFILLLGFLYLFVCSLDVLSSAFQLVGGKDPGAGGGLFLTPDFSIPVGFSQAPSYFNMAKVGEGKPSYLSALIEWKHLSSSGLSG